MSKKERLVQQRYKMLCDAYYDYILGAAIAYVQDKAIAEDVTHNVIIHIAENPKYLSDLENADACKAYLYRCVVNEINDQLKARNRHVPVGLSGEDIFANEAYSDDFTVLKGKYGFGEEMDEYFKSLSTKSVQFISMRFGEELTLREIAAKTGEKENTISKAIHRAKAKLFIMITDKEGHDGDK